MFHHPVRNEKRARDRAKRELIAGSRAKKPAAAGSALLHSWLAKTSTIKRRALHGGFNNPSHAGAWALGKNTVREDPPKVGDCHGRGRLIWADILEMHDPTASGLLSVRQMHKSAQFPAQPLIMAFVQGKP
jgi:hypothetical protein